MRNRIKIHIHLFLKCVLFLETKTQKKDSRLSKLDPLSSTLGKRVAKPLFKKLISILNRNQLFYYPIYKDKRVSDDITGERLTK